MDIQELWPGGPLFRQSEHFKLSTDSVLLADFVQIRGAKRGIDLGCGSGILSLLLAQKSAGLQMTGLELLPEAAAAACENAARNGMDSRIEVVDGDIRECRALFRAGSFDLLVCNPPYFPQGSGALPQDADRAAARSELLCTLSELCAAAAFLLQTGGRAFFVHRPERLSELLVCLTEAGLEPKRLRLVCRDAQASPSLVLVEARRGGRPGLTLEPSLYLQNPDGSESDEYKHIYHRI